jgi:hypothetical protein
MENEESDIDGNISKGYKARMASYKQRQIRGNARKYEWEKLILDGEILVTARVSAETVLCAARDFVKRRKKNLFLRSEDVKKDNISYVRVWVVKS